MKLSIPNPCSEDWAKMSPVEKGRHCVVCDHEVVDFTHFSDKKLVDFLDAQTGKVCGRISAQQLNRNLFIPEYESRNLLKRAAAVLALLGGASVGFAQEVPDTIVVQKNALSDSSLVQKDNKSNTVKGFVHDSNGKGVYDALVAVFDSRRKIILTKRTDSNGYFQISLNDSIKEVRLQFNYPKALRIYKSLVFTEKEKTHDIVCTMDFEIEKSKTHDIQSQGIRIGKIALDGDSKRKKSNNKHKKETTHSSTNQ